MSDKKNQLAKVPWKPMDLRDLGRVSEIVLSGAGKVSTPTDDTGDPTKKPKGQE